MADKNLLAYCGLYCGDCAGHTGDIAAAAEKLKQTLDRYRFERTARELFAAKLGEYEKLYEKIAFLAETCCPTPCRGKPVSDGGCAIRLCCIERGYFTCGECAEHETCEELASLAGLHGDAPQRNLKAINKMGLKQWLNSGKRLWFGDE